MISAKKITQDDIGILILILSFIIGAFFRLYLPVMSDFPINDGALFLSMIEAIQLNDFRLPPYVEYNKLVIPFAYPPLAFYIAGAISSVWQFPSIQVMMWMPAIVLILTLPFVFVLARLLTGSILQAGFAVFFYSFLPRSVLWFIMGGGVARSVGNLFLIISISQIYLMVTRRNRAYIFSSILFCSLTFAAHPEAALHTAFAGVLIWIAFDKTIAGFKNGLLVVLGTLTLTSPWWALVLSRFGFSPFAAASQTGLHSITIFLQFFDNISGEQLVTFISVLAILGLFHQISKRQPFLPAWVVFSFLLEPRNAPNVAVIPMSILASVYLTEIVLPGSWNGVDAKQGVREGHFVPPVSKVFLAYLFISILIGMLFFSVNLVDKTLPSDVRKSFQWIKMNTKEESKFLVITGDKSLFADFTNEWFPYFTERRSQTTIQGNEWLTSVDFNDQIDLLIEIQTCVYYADAIGCIEETTSRNQIDFDYIFLIKNGENVGSLLSELIYRDDYKIVYDSPESIIFFRHRRQADR